MKIVNVIPLSGGIFRESLSYFSSLKIKPGYIVEIPLRKKNVDALVVSVEDLSSSKAKLKASDFKIRKVNKIKNKKFFLPNFIEACKETGEYFLGTTGSVIKAMTPKVFLDNYESFQNFTPLQNESVRLNEKFVLQTGEDDRLSTYKSIIRSEFAKNSSVFFCLPNVQNADKILGSLKKGIEDYVFVLHSKMTKKQITEAYNNIISQKHPVLIIATGQFLFIPRNDIKTIIVEKENSKGYRTMKNPFMDIRVFAEILSSHLKTKFILGDTFLRPETIWRYQNNEFTELSPLKFRSLSGVNQQIIDTRGDKADTKKKFKIFSDEALKIIEKAKKNNEKTFVFTIRRGLFPLTVCGDCGNVVFCNNCHTPVVVHKSKPNQKTQNIFMCHKCGEQRDPMERCSTCQSWKLIPLGIGIENAEEELKKKYPDLHIFRIDSDATPTPKKISEVMKKFNDAPGSILLGTEMALAYVNQEINNSIVLSIDSLFSIPNFRINEKILNLLLSIRSFSQKNFIIQTRNPDEDIFKYINSVNLSNFYRDEIELREKFGYPPFKTFIKISLTGKKIDVVKNSTKLKGFLAEYSPEQFPALIKTAKGLYNMNLLLKLPREKWLIPSNKKVSSLDDVLLKKLLALPISYKIEVDPEDMF